MTAWWRSGSPAWPRRWRSNASSPTLPRFASRSGSRSWSGMLSAIDRIHCPPSNGMPVRYQRNPQTEALHSALEIGGSLIEGEIVFRTFSFYGIDRCPQCVIPCDQLPKLWQGCVLRREDAELHLDVR